MTAERPKTWGAQALCAVTMGAALLAAACETPTPPPMPSESDASPVIVAERTGEIRKPMSVDELNQKLHQAERDLANFVAQHGKGPWTPALEREAEGIRNRLSEARRVMEFTAQEESGVPQLPFGAKTIVVKESNSPQTSSLRITTELISSLDNPDEQPLILLDGREATYGDLSEIRPDAIERIDILKGRSATDQYGERGANGAILIVLKER